MHRKLPHKLIRWTKYVGTAGFYHEVYMCRAHGYDHQVYMCIWPMVTAYRGSIDDHIINVFLLENFHMVISLYA